MQVNLKRVAGILVSSVVLASLAVFLKDKARISSAYIGMLYTVVSIVFSVCMGVSCSLNLSRIKNNEFYQVIKKSSLTVRDTSIALFCLVTFTWITTTAVTCYWLTAFSYAVNLITLLYFVLNFKILQDLNYDIEDHSRSS